jgi:hypothetical protein
VDPCESAQTVVDRLPSSPGILETPQNWFDEGLTTPASASALISGFAAWYAAPTSGCWITVHSGYLDVSVLPNPYESATWRGAALISLWHYLRAAGIESAVQARADAVLGVDRAVLRSALNIEESPDVLLPWMLIVILIGPVGVLDRVLEIATTGGVTKVVAAACLVLANWLKLSDGAIALGLAQAAANYALAAGDSDLNKAGTALEGRVQLLRSSAGSSTTGPAPSAQPPAVPVDLLPQQESWWGTYWPAIIGGVIGAAIVSFAVRRKRRRLELTE